MQFGPASFVMIVTLPPLTPLQSHLDPTHPWHACTQTKHKLPFGSFKTATTSVGLQWDMKKEADSEDVSVFIPGLFGNETQGAQHPPHPLKKKPKTSEMKPTPQQVRTLFGIIAKRREVWECQAANGLFPCLLTQQMPNGPACMPGIQVVGKTEQGQTAQRFPNCPSVFLAL